MSVRELFSLAVVVFAGTGGELLVTRAMKTVGEVHDFSPRNLVRVLGRAFTVGWMWGGIALMALGFFALLAMLSWDNVSFVIPVTALSYAAGALGGTYLLGERVTPMRWLGVLLVCLGVALVWIG
jgi:drug/metabolite transporter (DMT)-like permease